MSTGAGIWRQVLAKGTQLRASAQTVVVAEEKTATREHPDAALMALVNQLFFSTATPPRKCVFFAASGREISVSSLCERVGRALSAVSDRTVALVFGALTPTASAADTLRVRPFAPAFRYPGAKQIDENVWSIPVERLQAEMGTRVANGRAALPFDYVIFGAEIADSAAPLFCRSCEAAVLLVAANKTRREAALRAKETLLSWNVKLLGTVLDDRTFPVPESIYRRL